MASNNYVLFLSKRIKLPSINQHCDMNLKPAKLALEKIISLYNAMSTDEKNISTIERDLMLNYIRQLYEVFLEGSVISAFKNEPSPAQKIKENVVRQNTDSESEMPDVYGTRDKVVAATPNFAPEKEVVRPEPARIVEQPKIETPPPPVYVAPPIEQPKPQPKPVEVARTTTPKVSASISALFDEVTSNELSDRLSNQHVADLTRGLGLNDKLLFQNNLFSNNKPAFDEVLKDINAMSSFDAARAFVTDIADRYSWDASEEKKKIARDFIRYMRRRFV